jgi:hypothetical protein
MALHANITEQEFIEAIDPCLRFGTEREYEETAPLACSISDNAALMVGLLLVSDSAYGSLDVNMRLIAILKRERPTRVILAAAPVIDALLRNQPPNHSEVAEPLTACKEHVNAWNGLAIVESADESLGAECELIRLAWKTERGS